MQPGFSQRYAGLNPAQRQAVDTLEGPVLVVAGPGSGKTELLGMRVAKILQETDMLPRNVLCLTFTDSAATTMRKRLVELIGADAYQVAIYTFHSFGVDILNRFPQYFYEGARTQPIDELGRIEILQDLISQLPAKNSLRKEHSEKGFTSLDAIKKRIQQCKQAGIRPAELLEIVTDNALFARWVSPKISAIFSERINRKTTPEKLGGLIAEITTYESASAADLPDQIISLAEATRRSLYFALTQAETDNTTVPISQWKQKHLARAESGEWELKECKYTDQYTTLAGLYAQYQNILYARALVDYDDMLLSCITALENHSDLRSEIQEQYQYLLVDEFQDTNDAQMRLLRLIAESQHSSGQPNLMVVGDDDQGVYKFQGAELSNIVNFRAWYPSASIVVLTQNYRSTQQILDLAREVITQGQERLELVYPEIVKDLRASGAKEGGAISHVEFGSPDEELHWLANQAQELVKAGVPAESIAFICRRHRELQNLAQYLMARGLPIRYEKQDNVFDAPHIHQLIILARLVQALAEGNSELSDTYISQALCFTFFGVDRKTLWNLSVTAREERLSWMDLLINHQSAKLQEIAEMLLEWRALALTETAETVLSHLIGASALSVADTGDEDQSEDSVAGIAMRSPYKEYYFSERVRLENPVLYLERLGAVRTLMRAVRNYKTQSRILLSDCLEMIDLYQTTDSELATTTILKTGTSGVNLLTAHHAKGMEFDHVYVIACQQSVWAGRGHAAHLPLPSNLAIAPSSDTEDDFLRLLYVAITRAEKHLTLSGYAVDESGKESLRLQFLSAYPTEKIAPPTDLSEKALQVSEDWEVNHLPPYAVDERAILAPLLESYRLSPTHLANYLDICEAGPQKFLLHNLLRFPEPQSRFSVYGTAVHSVIREVYAYLAEHQTLPQVGNVLDWFAAHARRARMSEVDTRLMLQSAEEDLPVFLEEYAPTFQPSHLIERDFSRQHVTLGDAAITGKIDRIIVHPDKTITLTDFKTGGSFTRWGAEDRMQRKAWRNRLQLLFYKLLVENARDYAGTHRVQNAELVFVTPNSANEIITLPLSYEMEEIERTRKLIQVVYRKIISFDFPDTAQFLSKKSEIESIRAFEDHLLSE